MSPIEKIISFIKNIFNKKEDVKAIQAPVEDKIVEKIEKSKKEAFIESLRVDNAEMGIKEEKQCEVETMIWNGNGLGIQRGMTS